MAAGHEYVPQHHVEDAHVFELPFGIDIPLGPISKFMLLQVVAAVVVFLIFRGLAKRAATGEPVRGRWWNFWETLALFIRDEVVRPTIGEGHHDHDDDRHADHTEPASGHPADKYLPFVWSCFFYVLLCNLIGAVPWMGAPMGNINVTAVLAACAFGATVLYGSKEKGVAGFWLGLCPTMDMPGMMKIVLVPMIWVIEFAGLFIKHSVLCVRLFANMYAGHMVIAVILGFIASANGWLYYVVLPSSILGQVAIGMLELFVAFLQAYVFAFLATLFISMAIHEH